MKVILYFAGVSAASGRARLHPQELRGEFEFEPVEFDIEHDPDLRRQFQNKAPVVKIGPYTLESPFTKLARSDLASYEQATDLSELDFVSLAASAHPHRPAGSVTG